MGMSALHTVRLDFWEAGLRKNVVKDLAVP